jgi:hypothetical protein
VLPVLGGSLVHIFSPRRENFHVFIQSIQTYIMRTHDRLFLQSFSLFIPEDTYCLTPYSLNYRPPRYVNRQCYVNPFFLKETAPGIHETGRHVGRIDRTSSIPQPGHCTDRANRLIVRVIYSLFIYLFLFLNDLSPCVK